MNSTSSVCYSVNRHQVHVYLQSQFNELSLKKKSIAPLRWRNYELLASTTHSGFRNEREQKYRIKVNNLGCTRVVFFRSEIFPGVLKSGKIFSEWQKEKKNCIINKLGPKRLSISRTKCDIFEDQWCPLKSRDRPGGSTRRKELGIFLFSQSPFLSY